MSSPSVENFTVKEEFIEYDGYTSDAASTKCGEVFLDHREGNFVFMCTLCPQSFRDLASFGEHIRNVHPISKIENPIPNSTEEDPSPLKLEPPSPRKLEPPSPLKLEPPDDIETYSELESDKVMETVEMEEECGPSEETSSNSHTGISKQNVLRIFLAGKTFCCFSCGKIYTVFESYRNHYRLKHPDMIEKDDRTSWRDPASSFVPKLPKEMSCIYCLKIFDDSSSSLYHTHMKYGHPDGLFTCPHCPKTFDRSNSRKYHIDSHEGNKTFKCPHCPKAFAHPGNLENHVIIHFERKSFACRFCNMKFIQKNVLHIHERTHTIEKPFRCNECDKAFIKQKQLKVHMENHKNTKSYKCPLCDKTCNSSKYLKVHVRTHLNESFSCEICQRVYRSKGSLRNHMRVHVGNKYACKMCDETFAKLADLNAHAESHEEVK